MDDKLTRLIVYIQGENGLIEDLLTLSFAKKVAIIAGDIVSLNEIIRQENHLMQALEKFEGERIKEQMGLEEGLGIPKNVSARLMINALQAAGLENWIELNSITDELAQNFEKLKEYNAVNAGLLEQSLAFLENMEALITGQRDTTYSVGGAVKENKTRSILDKTV